MFYIYILRCVDGSLYTGMTNDPERRFAEHCKKGSAGAKYTRSHPAVALEALWQTETHADAARLEYAIKTLRRPGKLALIREPTQLGTLLSDRIEAEKYEPVSGATLEHPLPGADLAAKDSDSLLTAEKN